MSILYDADIIDINTSRTVRGKKAAVKFSDPNGARDLLRRWAWCKFVSGQLGSLPSTFKSGINHADGDIRG